MNAYILNFRLSPPLVGRNPASTISFDGLTLFKRLTRIYEKRNNELFKSKSLAATRIFDNL